MAPVDYKTRKQNNSFKPTFGPINLSHAFYATIA